MLINNGGTSVVHITDKDFRMHQQNTDGKLKNGDLISILNYCLIEKCGWTAGDETSAEWTSYKPNLPFGELVVRDDGYDISGTARSDYANSYAFFVGVESVTDLLTSDYVNSFPSTLQDSGGLAIKKAMNWSFVGDDKGFYFFMYQQSAGYYYNPFLDNNYNDKNIVGFMSFGAFKSKRNSIYDVIIKGNKTDSYGQIPYLGRNANISNANVTVEGLYIARDDDESIVSKSVGHFFDFGTDSTSLNNYGFADKKLLMTPFRIINNNKIIGTMRGMYGSRNAISFRNSSLCIFSNENPLFEVGNRKYTAFCDSQNTKSGLIFDVTNWS